MRTDVTCTCDVVRGTRCALHLAEDAVRLLERQAAAETYLATRCRWRHEMADMYRRLALEHSHSAALLRRRYGLEAA